MVELAVRMGRDVRVTPACCSIALGEEVLALGDDSGVRVDLQRLIENERRRARGGIAGIPVVTA